MRIFKDMELVEQLGSGIPRVLRTYGRECFRFSDNYIRMSFPTEQVTDNVTDNVTEQVTDNVTDKVTDKVTDNQQKILEQIEQDSYITTRKMAEAVGISQRKIKGNIQILKEKGLLERIGPAKGGYWKIKKEI